jgi:hypothetical protein
MENQESAVARGPSHASPNGQQHDSFNVAYSASSSEDEAEQNASGKRKRPMSVSYAHSFPFNLVQP